MGPRRSWLCPVHSPQKVFGLLVMRMRLFAVNLLVLSLLAAGSQAQGLQPGASSPPDSVALRKPVKLSRKERRELAQRVEIEAKKVAAHPPLSAKEREMSEALYTDGVKYVILEDYPKALERLLKAYTLMPDNAAVNYKLAEANLLSGNLRDATGYAEAAVKLDAKNPYYYLLLAQSQASQKQYEAATATYASLVKEVPNSGSYLFQLADLYLAQNKLPEALATLEKAQAQFGSIDEIAFKKQQIYLRQNNLPLALKEGENLIAANPTESRFVVAQAEMYAANNRLPDAIRVAEQALRLEPGNPQARLILADVYRQQNQPAEVEKQLRLAFDSPALDIDQAVRILVGYIKQLPDPKVTPLALDLANATGWPFGGPWVKESDASKTVYYKTFTVDGGKTLSEAIHYNQEAMVRTANNKSASIDSIKRMEIIASLKENLLPFEVEELSEDNRHNEFVMINLRTANGISRTEFVKQFGIKAEKEMSLALQQFIDSGKVEMVDDRFVLTRHGKLFADGIAAELFR
ncbi:MAG: tetratricopeptide repeat protein [Hymenobacter sp.]|nr:MAG: tetratricopeptide repeat protein [Hymenobacter sp.]